MSDLPDSPPPGAAEPPVEEPVVHGPTPRALAISLAVLLFGLFLFVGIPAQLLHPAFGIWFNEVFVFLGVTWVALQLSGRNPVGYPRASRPAFAPAALGFLAGTANFFAIVVPIQSAMEAISPEWLKEGRDASLIFKNQTTVELVLIVAGVALVAPICEEYFFRGVFQNALSPKEKDRLPLGAMLVTGAVFSFFHLDPVGFPARFELGVLFGYLFYRTGSLWPGVMAHAANNLVSTVLYFAFRDLAESEQSPDPRVLAAMLLLGTPVVLGLLRLAVRLAASRPAPAPAAPVVLEGPPPSFATLARPWILGALASIALLVAVDRRGVVLNVYDLLVALPQEKATESPEAKRARAELQQLRKEARAGRIPVEDYVDERRETAEALRRPGEHPKAKPKVLPPTTGDTRK